MKKPKKIQPPVPKTGQELYFEIQSTCLRDYHSGEQFGEWESCYDQRLSKISRNSKLLDKYGFEAHKVPDEVYNAKSLYVVVVIYSTGDSFGHSRGNISLAFATEDPDEAIAVKESIELEDEHNNAYSRSQKKANEKEFWSNKFREHPKSLNTSNYTWNGYFESVEHVKVEFLQVIG